MKALFHLASELQNLFETRNWKFCFIGGIALQRWGEPRLTQDVDVSLLTGFGTEETFVNELLARYEGRIAEAKKFALSNRVLLLQSNQGIGIDIALACLPFEEEVVKRSSLFEFLPELRLRTSSAEDLVIMKSFADRLRDWADVEGILVRQQDHIDWTYVEKQLIPLCEIKHSPEIVDKLKSLRDKLKT